MKADVKRKVHSRPDVNIGKKGLTESVIKEIKKRVEKEGIIKVKINKNIRKEGFDRKVFAEQLARATGTEIVDLRGYTVILRKKRQ